MRFKLLLVGAVTLAWMLLVQPAPDGGRDIVDGERGYDRARVDRGRDDIRDVEKLF